MAARDRVRREGELLTINKCALLQHVLAGLLTAAETARRSGGGEKPLS